MFLGVLQVLKVTAFLGERDEVGEDHPSEANMVKRINGIGLNVLSVIVVQSSLKSILHVADGEHRLQMLGQLLHLQTLDLVVEVPHRH